MKKNLLVFLILLLPISIFAETNKNKSLNQQKSISASKKKAKESKEAKEVKENKSDSKSANQEEIIIDIVNYPTN